MSLRQVSDTSVFAASDASMTETFGGELAMANSSTDPCDSHDSCDVCDSCDIADNCDVADNCDIADNCGIAELKA